jgi:K+-sensing histidine kinase KdpD
MNVVFIIIIALLLAGGAIGFFFIHRRYERKLKKEVTRAQKSERLKSVFLENISRTLRTPLNAILGYTNMILEDEDGTMKPAQVKELATNIHQDTEQLLGFVSKVFELTQFEGVTPAFTFIEVNLIELMASYRREAMNYTKPDVGVRVTTTLSPHCRGVLDTNLMHQLMMHLLKNAAKHVAQGDIVIKYDCKRRGLHVSISYMGIGQAELVGTDIYSFLQKENALSEVNESSALGISISRAIVEVLGGEFYLDTENDKKTVASFWFPCEMKDLYKDM